MHLFVFTLKNGMKKPQKPCGVWGSATGIYFGHLMWLRGWDFSLPFRKHSRAASVRQARLAALLVFVTRLQKGRTASFLPRSPTPSAAARRLPEVAVKNPVSVIGKRKDHPGGWSFLLLVAGVGFEPHDLRVMSPTSYQAALPRDMKLENGAGSRDRTGTGFLPRDFKSRASASSAIPANFQRRAPLQVPDNYSTKSYGCQPLLQKLLKSY